MSNERDEIPFEHTNGDVELADGRFLKLFNASNIAALLDQLDRLGEHKNLSEERITTLSATLSHMEGQCKMVQAENDMLREQLGETKSERDYYQRAFSDLKAGLISAITGFNAITESLVKRADLAPYTPTLTDIPERKNKLSTDRTGDIEKAIKELPKFLLGGGQQAAE